MSQIKTECDIHIPEKYKKTSSPICNFRPDLDHDNSLFSIELCWKLMKNG